MLNRKFVMALAAAMVMAALYGCSGGTGGIKDERDAAQAAQAAAEMERDAANAAAAAAMAAQMTAEGERDAANAAAAAAAAAQMTAEGERDAANAAAAAAAAAQMTAEGARDAADAAAAAAMAAQMTAEGARDAADAAAAAAMAAQMTAEGARDAADAAAAAAMAAQMTAEMERDTANMAAAAAETARMMAVEAREAAEAAKMMSDEEAAAAAMRADEAETAQTTAEGERDAANTRANDAATAQMTAETERDAANTRANDAATAQMTAETERDAANTRANDAATAQMTAETERDAANTRANDAATAQMTAETERDAANTRANDAATAQMTAETERDKAQADLAAALVTVDFNNAYAKYTASRTAYTSALIAYNTVAANVKGATELMTAAEKAQTDANVAMGAAADGTATEMATAQAAVTAAGTAIAGARAELAEAQMTEKAMPFAGAIKDQNTEAMDMDHMGFAVAEHDGTNVMVTVTRGSVDDNDATDTIAADAMASGPYNGWYKANVANDDDSRLTATVYADIEDTMDKFTNVYNAADSDAITGVTNGVLGLSNTALALINMYAESSGFPGASRGTQTVTYIADDDNNPRKFTGTWGGVSGEYGCTGGTCSIEADSKGMITTMTGEWTFAPAYLGPDGTSEAGTDDDQIATRADDLPEPNVRVADDDYLRFGWWTAVDEEGMVKFRTFYGGQDPFTNGNITDLVGSAEYEGPAAGRYAVKTYNTNATVNSIREGTFSAMATLTARFGGDDIAVSAQDSIDGMITDFEDEHGNDLAGWRIMLTQIGDLQNLAADTAFTSDTVGGAVGGSPVSTGSWEGQFYGDTADTEGANDTAALPKSVAGKFEAHSSHGHVGGAFGASR